MITIIDYGAGNLKSIANMLEFLSCDFEISSSQDRIECSDALIFPGQGHFKQAIEKLEKSNLIPVIKRQIENNKPFLGICLGLQVLFEKSEEAPDSHGLKILKGEVKKFHSVKIPQIGWNKIETTENNSYLSDDYFYFVNSYYVLPQDEAIISSFCDYNGKFCASIEKNNLTAVQFHPEKSQDAGVNCFKNWLKKVS